uniref:TIP41-like protein n=1 Tax=Dracunculus medinensis TaxID=318479 RepID=A0A158Q626_DRAME
LEIATSESHILSSECHHDVLKGGCLVCQFRADLKLPHLPEMVFPNNSITIRCKDQPEVFITFNALDALKEVNAETSPDVQVKSSTAWQQARSNKYDLHSGTSFDWTFTSEYQGTVQLFKISPTNTAIDVEKLKRRDPIVFYSHLTLYEDELADHGCAQMDIRVRVMPTYLFLLARFYLRIDEVLVRILDTRLFAERGKDFILREWTKREAKNVNNSNEIWQHLPVIESKTSKLVIPT